MSKNKCPKCGDVERQVWNGKNPSGSQKFKCMKCERVHTPNPNQNGYPEDVRKQAKKLVVAGVSGRRIGQMLGFSKANAYNWCKDVKKTKPCVDKSAHI